MQTICKYQFLIWNSKRGCISKVWCCTYLDNSAREIIIQGCGGMWIFEVIFTLVCHFLSFVQKYNLYVWGTKENLELCLPESDLTIGWWWLLMAQWGCKLHGISVQFLSPTILKVIYPLVLTVYRSTMRVFLFLAKIS